ncbi:hypothetical protein [Floccifex porci]|nr:hypothetical protein [Floccifex porci]
MEQLKNLDLNQFMNNLNEMDIKKLGVFTVGIVAGAAIATIAKIMQ